MIASTPFQRGKKVIFSVQLDIDQCEAIDLLSTKRRTSRSAVIREAVDLYLAENTSETSSLSDEAVHV